MSFSFRDKGRLSDRLRGKTCDEILKELRDHLHQDRSMSFDSTPSWGGFSTGPAFSRAGFPFMDQDMMQRPDMRAHFEDLASRHPEFADHLRPTAWGTVPEADPHFFHPAAPGPDVYRQRHASGSSGSGSGVYSEDSAIPIPVIHEDSGGGGASSRSRTRKIPQYGLRNTVDLGESQKGNQNDPAEGEARSQRSWSAPPDNRAQGEAPQPKRFVTRVDINNGQGNPSTSGANDSSTSNSTSGVSSPGKPPPFPKSSGPSSPQTQQPSSKQSNVRHIPIFVEGRDEPVLPKSKDSHAFASSHSPGYGQPNFSYSYAQAPPGTHSTAFASSHASSSPPGQNRSHPNPPQAHKPPQPQASNPPEQKQNIPLKQPQASKPVNPKDPIAKVQAIQEEVNELKNIVERFSGTRNDKEYIYLDEMLTRNLIKLDDIETDGKENIRQARKEAIKSIQKCISILESIAPLPQDTRVEEQVEGQETDAMEAESLPESSKEQVTEPSSHSENNKQESMNVDEKVESSEQLCSTDADVVTSENNGQGPLTEKPMDVNEDVEAEKILDSSISTEKETEQDLEKMEVVSEQPVVMSAASGSQHSEETEPRNENVSDADMTKVNGNTASGTVEVKIEPIISAESGEVSSAVNESSSTNAGDAPIVKEVSNDHDEVKPASSVEDTPIEEAVTMSEVDVSKSEATSPQYLEGMTDKNGEQCEVDTEKITSTAEANQSVEPKNLDAEKAASS